MEGKGEKREEAETREVKKVKEKIKGMEIKIEKWEKEKRKRNIMIKGVKSVKGDLKWGVEQIMKKIGAKVNIKKIKRIKK